MATPEQFAQELNRIALSIEPNTASVMRRVVGQLLEDVVRGTPVDTGKARSNWQVTLGAPSHTVIGPYAPGKKLGIGENSNANAAIAAGQAALRNITEGTLETPVVVSNSVFYIDTLRRGTSRQQPVDWVDIALRKAATSLRLTNLLQRGNRR